MRLIITGIAVSDYHSIIHIRSQFTVLQGTLVLIKLFLLCLMCGISYNAYSGEKNCPENMVSVNAFNNFIFSQEQQFNDSLREVNLSIKSKDDYISNSTHVKFDVCGRLLNLKSNEVIKSQINKNILTSTKDATVNKNDKGWDYKVTFKMSNINQEDGIENTLILQKINGKFQTDRNGKINKSEDVSSVFFGKERMSAKAVTTFSIDDKGRISELNRISTMKNDSVNTIYSYDSENRLIQTRSGSTTENFTYDDNGRELSNKKVQEFFTTETTVTTCKNWNKFGRCTSAEQNISVLIKGDKGKEDTTYNHHADVEYNYVY